MSNIVNKTNYRILNALNSQPPIQVYTEELDDYIANNFSPSVYDSDNNDVEVIAKAITDIVVGGSIYNLHMNNAQFVFKHDIPDVSNIKLKVTIPGSSEFKRSFYNKNINVNIPCYKYMPINVNDVYDTTGTVIKGATVKYTGTKCDICYEKINNNNIWDELYVCPTCNTKACFKCIIDNFKHTGSICCMGQNCNVPYNMFLIHNLYTHCNKKTLDKEAFTKLMFELFKHMLSTTEEDTNSVINNINSVISYFNNNIININLFIDMYHKIHEEKALRPKLTFGDIITMYYKLYECDPATIDFMDRRIVSFIDEVGSDVSYNHTSDILAFKVDKSNDKHIFSHISSLYAAIDDRKPTYSLLNKQYDQDCITLYLNIIKIIDTVLEHKPITCIQTLTKNEEDYVIQISSFIDIMISKYKARKDLSYDRGHFNAYMMANISDILCTVLKFLFYDDSTTYTLDYLQEIKLIMLNTCEKLNIDINIGDKQDIYNIVHDYNVRQVIDDIIRDYEYNISASNEIDNNLYTIADNDKVMSALINVLIHKPISKCTYIMRCSQCDGGLVTTDYVCSSCNAKYCKQCGQLITDDGTHKHTNDDIETWNNILKDTKPCPWCYTRINKKSGCDDMFCTVCHKMFKWNTLEKIYGTPHNPERADWLANRQRTIINDLTGLMEDDFKQPVLNNIAINGHRLSFIAKMASSFNDLSTSIGELYNIIGATVNANSIITKLNSIHNTSLKFDAFHSINLIENIYRNYDIISTLVSNRPRKADSNLTYNKYMLLIASNSYWSAMRTCVNKSLQNIFVTHVVSKDDKSYNTSIDILCESVKRYNNFITYINDLIGKIYLAADTSDPIVAACASYLYAHHGDNYELKSHLSPLNAYINVVTMLDKYDLSTLPLE